MLMIRFRFVFRSEFIARSNTRVRDRVIARTRVEVLE